MQWASKKSIYPRKKYQIPEAFCDKLDSFGNKYTSWQKLLKNLAIFNFESICVQEETFDDTKTATWIGKHVSIPVSKSSNFDDEPIFSATLILTSLHLLLEHWKVWPRKVKHIWNFFLQIEIAIKIKLGSILEKLTQRLNW